MRSWVSKGARALKKGGGANGAKQRGKIQGTGEKQIRLVECRTAACRAPQEDADTKAAMAKPCGPMAEISLQFTVVGGNLVA